MALSKEEIKKYLEADLFQKGLESLDLEARLALLAKLTDVVYLKFINALASRLSDEESEKLEEMAKNNDVEGFSQLIEQKVPDYNEILSEIIAQEKKGLLEIFAK